PAKFNGRDTLDRGSATTSPTSLRTFIKPMYWAVNGRSSSVMFGDAVPRAVGRAGASDEAEVQGQREAGETREETETNQPGQGDAEMGQAHFGLFPIGPGRLTGKC